MAANDKLGPLPDFLIIGTQRGGTTYLYELLCRDLRVRPGKRKETHFFDKHYGKGKRYYRSLFRNSPKRRPELSCDSTPYYLFDPRVSARVHQMLPEAKLIVLLRNPIDRAYSHFFHARRQGMEPIEDFGKAVSMEGARLLGARRKYGTNAPDSDENRKFSYLSRGYYADQLKRWFAYYPRESFQIIQSERFYADSESVVEECRVHVGAYRRIREQNRAANTNFGEYEPMQPELRELLSEHFAPYNEQLYTLLDVDYGW